MTHVAAHQRRQTIGCGNVSFDNVSAEHCPVWQEANRFIAQSPSVKPSAQSEAPCRRAAPGIIGSLFPRAFPDQDQHTNPPFRRVRRLRPAKSRFAGIRTPNLGRRPDRTCHVRAVTAGCQVIGAHQQRAVRQMRELSVDREYAPEFPLRGRECSRGPRAAVFGRCPGLPAPLPVGIAMGVTISAADAAGQTRCSGASSQRSVVSPTSICTVA